MATTLTLSTPSVVPQPISADRRSFQLCWTTEDDAVRMIALGRQLATRSSSSLALCCIAGPGHCSSPAHTWISITEQQILDRVARGLNCLGLDCLKIGFSQIQQAVDQEQIAQGPRLCVMTRSFCAAMSGSALHPECEVVRRLGIPVLIINGDERSGRYPFSSYDALAAVSLSDGSIDVARATAETASVVGAGLRVVHAVDILHDFSRPDSLMSLLCECQILAGKAAPAGMHAEGAICYGTLEGTLGADRGTAPASFIGLGLAMDDEESEAIRSDAIREKILSGTHLPILIVPIWKRHPIA